MNHERISHIPRLPERAIDAHKGDVGRVLVVGGMLAEHGMIGAPALAANASLKSGCGLVQIITSAEAQPYVGILAPCATTRKAPCDDWDISRLATEFGADVIAIGPGAGDTISGNQLIDLFHNFSGGIVVDADAINALATVGRWNARWPHNVVLTPHPGEMSRLLRGWGMPDTIDSREDCALMYAAKTGVTVVLKGAGTVVTDGQKVYVNQTGNAGMATAGSGDVLTGIVAALIGQRMVAFDAAVLGVYVHGLAGDSAAEQLGRMSLVATDLLEFLPEALCDLESHIIN